MHAENPGICRLIVDYCSERHVIEEVVNFCEDTIWIVNVFTESLGTFLAKSEVFVHVTVLVVAS